MYDKSTPRVLRFFFLVTSSSGAPAGYCVPVGLMVAFLQCVKHSIRGPRGILCFRGDKRHQNSDVLGIFKK